MIAITTRKSLLAGILAGDEISWQEFYKIYGKLIMTIGTSKEAGLTSTEAADLVQNVMLNIFNRKVVFKYDPAKGKFRNYLIKTIWNSISDIQRARKNELPLKEEILSDKDDDNEEENDYDNFLVSTESEDRSVKEWKQHLFAEGMKILRTREDEGAFQAFQLHAMQGVSAKETAKKLGIQESQVYRIKYRLIQKLKEIVTELQEEK